MINKVVVLLMIISSLLCANYYELKPIKITKDISCIIADTSPPTKENNGFVSNVCYVNMGDSIVVLDAGPTYSFAQELHNIIKQEYPQLDISHVIITNYHDDRLLGASYFSTVGTKIVAYKAITYDINSNIDKFDRIKNIVSKDVYKDTRLIYPDILVDNGYSIVGKNKTIQIIKPSKVSEEKSDIAVFVQDDSFLFVGNIVFNDRLLSYKDSSNVDGWIQAIQNLANMNTQYMLGGHGKGYDKNSYKTTLEYLQILKSDTKKAYDAGVDIQSVKSRVDTSKFGYLSHYEQLNSLNITAYYNQLEWE